MPKYPVVAITTKKKTRKKKASAAVVIPSTRMFKSVKQNPAASFPKTREVRMKYVEYRNMLTGVITPVDQYAYRANSAYDPDATGVGHQPLGFDQWSQFYNKYVVTEARMTVKGQGQSYGSTPYILGILLSDDVALSANLASNGLTVCEQPHAIYDFGSPTANGWQTVCTKKYNAKKWHNVTNVKDSTQLTANVTADPADPTYFIIYMSSYRGQNNDVGSTGVAVHIMIEYTVVFSDPKQLDQS